MTQSADQIRADIERTRAGLADDVDALENKVSPSKVAARTVDGAKDAVLGAKDKLIGSAHDLTGSVTDTAGSAVDTAKASPGAVRERASGSPLIAGAVAFGVEYLLSSLLPATRREAELAGVAKDRAHELAGPAKEQISSLAGEAREQLAPVLAEAAESVRESASGAVQTVKEAVTDAGTDVAGSARTASQA